MRHLKKLKLLYQGYPPLQLFHFSRYSSRLEELLSKEVPVVCLSKGIDPNTLELPMTYILIYFLSTKIFLLS